MALSPYDSDGISEISSEVLILILVVALAGILLAIFTGALSPLFQKTSLVAATGAVSYVPISSSVALPVFDIMPIAGEKFYLTGQQDIPSGSPAASFLLVAPDGTSSKTTLGGYSAESGQYGKPLYIYRNDDFTYKVTDSLVNKSTRIRDIPKGTWTIKMIDNTNNVALTEMTVLVTGSGFIVNPTGSTTIWTNATNLTLTNSTGYQIPFTNYGVIPYVGPNGLQMFSFNGTGAYITGADNPDLDFTGDLSLSLWLDPDTTSGYHEIVGKGQAGDTNENYEMFLINGRIYFEWTDESSHTVYHIMTNSAVVGTDLRYVALTINSGTPTIYYNGVSQPFGYYHSNVPGSNPVGAVAVDLIDNSNPITIGKQNYPGAEFYYDGNMSEVSFYNRALTADEIASNIANYQT